MLTADLVQARLYRGVLRPGYVKTRSPSHLEHASALIDLFSAHRGSPRRELDAALKEMPVRATRLRLHRGLAKLLWDRCGIGVDCPIEPSDLRRELFRQAAASYRDANRTRDLLSTTEQTLGEAARSHDIDRGTIRRWLYSDLKNEQVIEDFDPLAPEQLLARYNVALAQATLLRATDLTLTLGDLPSRALREIFRRLRFFRLLYRLTRLEDGYRVHLDGPLSLFRSSQRYGFQMAAFLPTLLHLEGWELEATLNWTRDRKAIFRLDPATGLEPFGRLPAQWVPKELEGLLHQLSTLKGPWAASPKTELLELGEQVMVIPDLVLEHASTGTRVFVEVFGYWRSGSIRDRLQLLRSSGAPLLILALGRHMACDAEDLAESSQHLYRFRRTPVARELVAVAEGLLPEVS